MKELRCECGFRARGLCSKHCMQQTLAIRSALRAAYGSLLARGAVVNERGVCRGRDEGLLSQVPMTRTSTPRTKTCPWGPRTWGTLGFVAGALRLTAGSSLTTPELNNARGPVRSGMTLLCRAYCSALRAADAL